MDCPDGKERNPITGRCVKKCLDNEERIHTETKFNCKKTRKRKIKETNNKTQISHINSQTAKNGYIEEELVCNDLKNNTIRTAFSSVLGNEYDECSRNEGNHKCDIQSNNNKLRAQVKKYKNGQFQQLDRHWLEHMLVNIPELKEATTILKDLYEYPLLPNKTHIDKNHQLKKLCTTNYPQETLDEFILLLNRNKRRILEYAFFGTNPEIKPLFLFGVEYVRDIRKKIVVFRIKDAIDYLTTLDFKISPRKTAIILGDNGIISLQRKGGDGGKKCSNQLQIKIIVGKILDVVENKQFVL
jgi:hypothetical protein